MKKLKERKMDYLKCFCNHRGIKKTMATPGLEIELLGQKRKAFIDEVFMTNRFYFKTFKRIIDGLFFPISNKKSCKK